MELEAGAARGIGFRGEVEGNLGKEGKWTVSLLLNGT